MSSFQDALSAAASTSVNAVTIPSISPLAALFSLKTSSVAVGTAWMISSAVFTTYTATKFLKFSYFENENQPPGLLSQRKRRNLHRPFMQRPVNRFVSLPPASMLTMYRFAGSLLLGLLLHPDLAVVDRFRRTLAAVPALALPATFLFVANFANSLALERIGISLTYTSKCGIPLITVLLTVLLEGVSALPNVAALASLVPIAVGIAAASWSAPTFEALGFAAAALSATAQSALNVTSKRVMTKANITGPDAQRTMVAVGLFITLVVNLLQVARYQRTTAAAPDETADGVRKSTPPFGLTALAVIAYHVEYVLSFIFVKLVAPVTYGTCDAVRRLAIILVGRGLFGGDPLTVTNILGIALALLGALAYAITSSL